MSVHTFNITPTRQLDRKITFDMDLDPANPSEDWILEHFRNGLCYEQEVAHVMMRTLRPGDFAIDVGANVGFFTLLMSKLVGPTGLILAFEPGDNNLPKLKHNLALNHVDNVKLIEQPLWCREEEIDFYHNADSTGGNCLWDPGLWWENKKSRAEPNVKKVLATLLDAHLLAANGVKTRLVKLDTEGAEQKILEGALFLLDYQRPPYIILELNPFGLKQFDNTAETLRAYLRQFGYDCFLIHNDNSLPTLVPPNSEITYQDGIAVINVLFSTIEAVGEAWPRVPYE